MHSMEYRSVPVALILTRCTCRSWLFHVNSLEAAWWLQRRYGTLIPITCMQGSKGSKQVTQAKQLNVAINGFGRIGAPQFLPPARDTEPGIRDIGNLCMYAFKCTMHFS